MNLIDQFYENAKRLLNENYYNYKKRSKKIINFMESLNGRSIIGEIKFSSPAGNITNSSFNEIVDIMNSNFISAISVLTEPAFFKGSLEYLELANEMNKPLLMKDFIIDEKQILSGFSYGADSILIILKLTMRHNINERRLINFARNLGLQVIVEVNSIEEYIYGISLEPDMIGVNTRNLDNLNINFDILFKIKDNMDRSIKHIAMSGFDSTDKIKLAFDLGYNSILIGTALMKNKQKFIKMLGDIHG